MQKKVIMLLSIAVMITAICGVTIYRADPTYNGIKIEVQEAHAWGCRGGTLSNCLRYCRDKKSSCDSRCNKKHGTDQPNRLAWCRNGCSSAYAGRVAGCKASCNK